jgi:hypothetical protein
LAVIEKNVFEEDNWSKAVDEDRIKIIRKCKNAFYRHGRKIALRIIIHIFDDYKEKGKIPNSVSFIQ